MKWVVGSIAVLVALVAGITVGWVMRGRADEPLWREHVAALSAPHGSTPPVSTPTPTTTTTPPPPSVGSAKPDVWTEDTEAFAWPTKASDDVVAVDATHYLVKRAFFVKVTSTNAFVTARAIPHVVDGGVNGFSVFGIRTDSDVAKLGVRNGDTFLTVNGLSLTSAENALAAQTHTRDGKSFVLSLERRGAPIELHYRVVD